MASSREENFTIEDLMKSAGNEPYLDSGLEDLNDEEKMNNLLRELIEGSGDPEEPQHEVPEIRDIFKPPPGYGDDYEIRDIFKPVPGYGLHGKGGDGSLYRGSTTSGGGSDNYYGVPGKTSSLDDALKQLDALKEIIANPKPNDYRKYEKELSEAFENIIPPSPGKTSSLDDALERLDALKEFIANPKTYDYNRMKELFTKTKVGGMLQDSSNRGGSTTSGGGQSSVGGGVEPSVYAVGAPLGFPGQLDHRIFQPPSGDGGYGVPGQLDHPIFQQSFSGGAKQLVDAFGRWLVENPPSKERPHTKVWRMFQEALDKIVGGGSTTSGGGGVAPTKNKATYRTDPMRVNNLISGGPIIRATDRPHLMRGGGSSPPTTSATYQRAIDPPSIYREEGMFTPAPGRDLNSRMDSGLDYLNPKEEPPSLAYPTMDKLGAGFYAPTKQTKKEPELFGTFLKSLLGKGMFQDVEFKPWALDKFEDRMNEAPLVERWAAQMKEEIGWQYMTPAERKDYIKKNKNNKNNHIIMDYNMYRRR